MTQEYLEQKTINYLCNQHAVIVKNKKSRFVKEQDAKSIRKKLNCKFIRINTSRKNYDADYKASRIHTFISNSNKSKIKELEDEIKKLKLQWANPNVQNNDDNDNDNDNDNNNNNNKIKKYCRYTL